MGVYTNTDGINTICVNEYINRICKRCKNLVRCAAANFTGIEPVNPYLDYKFGKLGKIAYECQQFDPINEKSDVNTIMACDIEVRW